MGSVSSFENHLFISYAHIDNEHLPEVEKGWIDRFHEALKQRLQQLQGGTVKIWRDEKLGGNDVFNSVIEDELAKTALLVSVITPRYLESKSCMDELEGFIKVADESQGLQIGNKYRIFKAIKTPVPLTRQPPKLQEMLGYEFYVVLDSATNRFREYDYLIGPNSERDKRFWDKVEDLAQGVSALLAEIADNKAAQLSGETVYLAETTRDLIQDRDQVKRELQQNGNRVLPDKPLPAKSPALDDAVREYVAQSKLSIHMVGEFHDSIIGLQQRLAVKRGDAGFSTLIWLPPGLQPQDPDQQRFINDLRNSFTSENRSELLETKLEDLKTIIGRKLRSAGQQPLVTEATDSEQPLIYLMCDKADREAVKPLYNHLVWDHGFAVTISLTEGDSSIIRQHRRDNLLICDGVIVFFGDVGDQWWSTQVDELRKIRGYGRKKPLSRAVYLAAPRTDEKDLLESSDPLVIRGFDGFKPESVDQFIRRLAQVRGVEQ